MKHILCSLYHHRLLNTIVVVTIAIGLMFPLAILSSISFMLDNVALCSYKDPQNRIVTNCMSAYQTPEQLDEWLVTDEVINYGYFAYRSSVLHVSEKGISLCGVSGITQNYLDLEGYRLESGRLITADEYKNGAHVCLAKFDSGTAVGDSFSLLGVDYEIVGLISMPKLYGTVAVPYRCMEELAAGSNMQFCFSFQMSSSEAANRFRFTSLDFADSIVNFGVGDEINAPYIASIQSHISEFLNLSSIVIFAAFFSILFILMGKVFEERYLIGLRISMGATGTKIYIDLLLENGILTLCALLLDLLFFPIVIRRSRIVYGYPSAWMLACIAAALIVIVAAVSGIVYIQNAKRTTPATLLKEEV